MITEFSQLIRIVLSTLCIFAGLVLLFRKHIFHLFDPLLYFILTQAFSIQLAVMVITEKNLLAIFFISEISFFIGFFLAAGKPLSKADKAEGIFYKSTSAREISVLKWYAIFGTILLVIGNLVLIKQKGITLFSSNPSDAKVNNFTEGSGLGIVRRMNADLLYWVGIILIYLLIYKKQFKYGWLTLLIMLFAVFGGSKSALLFFIFLSAFLFCFSDLSKNVIVKKLKTGTYILIIFSVILLGFVLFASGAGSIDKVVLNLGTRFLFYGDAIIYYFNKDSVQHFSNYNIFTFLRDEFNSVLGFLRLTPYESPLNFRVLNYFYNMPGNETFGPNMPFYIKGNIYFGMWGGFLYSFIIGVCVGYARRLFYLLVRNSFSSILISIFIIFLNIAIYSLPQDSVLFITRLFNIFLLSLPLIIFVMIIHLPQPQLSKS